MPTGGTARFSSPLSVFDFLKLTSIIALDDEAVKSLGSTAATIARAEGLTAHAKAVEMRLEPHRE
jgi:histidinol dehydrogenase